MSVEEGTVVHQQSMQQHRRLVQLEKRVEHIERRLDGLWKEFKGVSLRSSFSNALRPQRWNSSDGVVSCNSSTKSDGGTSLGSVRIGLADSGRDATFASDALTHAEAVEAKCDNLKKGVQDALSAVETTEAKLRTALDHQGEQLWHELAVFRMQNTANLRRIEEIAAEAIKRAQEAERHVEAGHQEHVSLKDGIKHAMQTVEELSGDIERQFAWVREELKRQDQCNLHASMRFDFAKTCDVQSTDQSDNIANSVVDDVSERVEDITLQMKGIEKQQHKQAAEVAVMQLRLGELELEHVQQHKLAAAVAAQAQQSESRTKFDEAIIHMQQANTALLTSMKHKSSFADLKEFMDCLVLLVERKLRGDGVEAKETFTLSDVEQWCKSPVVTHADVQETPNCAGHTRAQNEASTQTLNLFGSLAPTCEWTTGSGGCSSTTGDVDQPSRMMDFASQLCMTESKLVGHIMCIREMLADYSALLHSLHRDVQDLQPRMRLLEVWFVEFQGGSSPSLNLQQVQRRQQQRLQSLQVSPNTAVHQLAEGLSLPATTGILGRTEGWLSHTEIKATMPLVDGKGMPSVGLSLLQPDASRDEAGTPVKNPLKRLAELAEGSVPSVASQTTSKAPVGNDTSLGATKTMPAATALLASQTSQAQREVVALRGDVGQSTGQEAAEVPAQDVTPGPLGAIRTVSVPSASSKAPIRQKLRGDIGQSTGLEAGQKPSQDAIPGLVGAIHSVPSVPSLPSVASKRSDVGSVAVPSVSSKRSDAGVVEAIKSGASFAGKKKSLSTACSTASDVHLSACLAMELGDPPIGTALLGTNACKAKASSCNVRTFSSQSSTAAAAVPASASQLHADSRRSLSHPVARKPPLLRPDVLPPNEEVAQNPSFGSSISSSIKRLSSLGDPSPSAGRADSRLVKAGSVVGVVAHTLNFSLGCQRSPPESTATGDPVLRVTKCQPK